VTLAINNNSNNNSNNKKRIYREPESVREADERIKRCKAAQSIRQQSDRMAFLIPAIRSISTLTRKTDVSGGLSREPRLVECHVALRV
jgi:hypothetical protein